MNLHPATHILLPTHDRVGLLRRCLNSLQAVSDELDGVTLHVIENGSRVAEGLVATYRNRLPVRYHHSAIGNKSLALNQVIETLPATAFLLFLDDDVAVRPGTIAAFRSAAAEYGPGNLFGGILYPEYQTPPAPEVVPYLPPSARKIDLSNGKPRRVIEDFTYFMGACWACFLRDLTGVGSFRASFGPGANDGARGQETDAQHRLVEAGIKPIFIGEGGVAHWVTAEMVTAKYACERIFLASIYRGRVRPSHAHSIVMLIKLVYSLMGMILNSGSVGHRYRIAKAAGYFRGLSQTD